MLPFRRRIPPGVFFGLGVVILFACKSDETKDDEEDDNQFREDVIQCEEAIARLEKCCPGFDGSRVLCNYYFNLDKSSCGPTEVSSVKPALDLSESRCVLDTSCENLVSREVCQRAQEARTYTNRQVSSSSSSGAANQSDSHPPVCP